MFINDVVKMEKNETKKERLSLMYMGEGMEREKPLLLLILNKWNNNWTKTEGLDYV